MRLTDVADPKPNNGGRSPVSSSNNISRGGLGLIPLLVVVTFAVFLTLKLAEVGQVASWSWWWVTAPVWGFFGVIAVVMLLAVLCMGIALLFGDR